MAAAETTTGDRLWIARRTLRLLSCIRFDEVLVLQGTPMLGALFSLGSITTNKCLDILVFAIASVCLVAHVFVLNDWSGAMTDLRDPNRAEGVFTAKGVSGRAVGILCISLLAVSLGLLAPYGMTPMCLALALAALSALYSAPPFAMKGVPIASSVLHIAGGLIHFLLGYSLFRPLNWPSVWTGSFFALMFAAGHLTHEARDCDSDNLNGIQTNAVRFGAARNFVTGAILFTAADVLLFVLAANGVVPRVLMLVAAVYPLHLRWMIETWNAGPGFQTITRLQQRYRTLYAVMGVAMALATRI